MEDAIEGQGNFLRGLIEGVISIVLILIILVSVYEVFLKEDDDMHSVRNLVAHMDQLIQVISYENSALESITIPLGLADYDRAIDVSCPADKSCSVCLVIDEKTSGCEFANPYITAITINDAYSDTGSTRFKHYGPLSNYKLTVQKIPKNSADKSSISAYAVVLDATNGKLY
jgi:hypothetical protein